MDAQYHSPGTVKYFFKVTWHSNQEVVPLIRLSRIYLAFSQPQECLAPPSWWGLPLLHNNNESEEFIFVFSSLGPEKGLRDLIALPFGFSQ